MHNRLIVILFSLFLILFVSCKKDTGVLGLEVQPAYDLVEANATESQPVITYTEKIDSIISFNSSSKFLGSIQDPYFGRTDVGLYLNANLEVSNTVVESTATLTSAEIILEVRGIEYMGDAATAMTYSVFPLDSALLKDRYYYTTNNRLHNKGTVVAAFTGSYTTLDGKVVLRIPLDPVYAKSLLTNSVALVSNDEFQKQYKGYYISSESTQLNPQSSPGIVSLFDLSTSLSALYIRYKKTTTAEEESLKLSFVGEKAVRYNTVKYQANQGGHYLLTSQLQGDTIKGNENTFLKGLGNTKIIVKIPGLKSKVDSFFVSVNRAEVIINVDNAFKPTFGKYDPPSLLTLIPLDSLGRESLGIHSMDASDINRYDGKYDETAQRYVFNVARFAQLVMTGKVKNYGFHLIVANPERVIYLDEIMRRVVLHGMNKWDLRPKCNLYYVNLTEK